MFKLAKNSYVFFIFCRKKYTKLSEKGHFFQRGGKKGIFLYKLAKNYVFFIFGQKEYTKLAKKVHFLLKRGLRVLKFKKALASTRNIQ